MDKGANFYCCDFQVHTPRDRGWHGENAVTDNERKAYAVNFVKACREKGLTAVAITDHHDMAFIPYLREVASNEHDEEGNLISEENQLVVFPGMELTLAIPCQALLIFDADFPEDLFNLVLNGLAINQANAQKSKCSDVTRLEHTKSFDELYKELNKHKYLKGRYIVLPNVSEGKGGASTLLRSGHASHYKNMPCVGGYLDGKIDQFGQGNIGIVTGKNADYGNKAIGLFQTSDNRRSDFRDLGIAVTWVKWAKPTAEGLRQACLASESRLSQETPLLPSVTISSINVSNSGFMGPLYIEFNRQFNAIIGGRGTGKSTILEYLRWALCDEPPILQGDEDLPNYHSKREKLVKQTLIKLNANVQVDFVVNGVPHSVRRDAATNELLLKIGTQKFEPCNESDIKNLLPIQAYSQKQLSSIGVRLDELNRFISAPIQQILNELDSRLGHLASEIRTTYITLQEKRTLESEINKLERESKSLAQQVSTIRTQLTGLSEDDQATLAKRTEYDKEDEIVTQWLEDIRSLKEALEDLKPLISNYPKSQDESEEQDTLPNTTVLKRMNTAITSLFENIATMFDQSIEWLASTTKAGDRFFVAKSELDLKHEEFKKECDAAKAKSTAHQSKLKQLELIETRQKEIRGLLANKKTELTAVGTPENEMNDQREQWCLLHIERTELLENQCTGLTTLSDGQILATLKKGSSTKDIAEKLKTILAGANIRGTKIEKFCKLITSGGEPIRKYQDLLEELELLALRDLDDPTSATLPPTPELRIAGFNEQDLDKISMQLTPEKWLNLSLVLLNDTPQFEYKVRENKYIQFADASAGQQATSLLWALLNQDGPPLVIDQPEDDLDNKLMPQIVEQVWQAKKRRQLIFTSHNANLVVNGDAELIICCDYRVAGEQSGGEIKYEGAIDVKIIRDEITGVMEGGRDAFKLRKDKYGF